MRPFSALGVVSRLKARRGPNSSGWLSRVLPPLAALGVAAAFSTASALAAADHYPCEPLELTAQVVSYPSTGRAIFVGDVHGCALELTKLLAAVEFDEDDLLVLVGDLIGKGPDSTGVIKLARALGPQCIAIRGNHDQAILDWYAYILRPDLDNPESPASQTPLTPEELMSPPPASSFEVMPDSMETHKECAESLSASDWAWLGSLPTLALFPELNAIAIHAGLVPGAPLSHTEPRDAFNIRFVSPAGGEERPTKTWWPFHRSTKSDTAHALWARVYSGVDGPKNVPHDEPTDGATAEGEGVSVLRALLRALDDADSADADASASPAAARGHGGVSVSVSAIDTVPLLPLPLQPALPTASQAAPAPVSEDRVLSGSGASLRSLLVSPQIADATEAAADAAVAAEAIAEAGLGQGVGLSLKTGEPDLLGGQGQGGVRVDVAAIESALLSLNSLGSSREETSYTGALGGSARPHVIFGHDAKQGLQLLPYATGLDSGAVYGRRLSALVFPPRMCWGGVAKEGRRARRRVWTEAAEALEKGGRVGVEGVGAVVATEGKDKKGKNKEKSEGKGIAQGVAGMGPLVTIVPAGTAADSIPGITILGPSSISGTTKGGSNSSSTPSTPRELTAMAHADAVPAIAGQLFHAEDAEGAACHHWLRPQIVQVQSLKCYAPIKFKKPE